MKRFVPLVLLVTSALVLGAAAPQEFPDLKKLFARVDAQFDQLQTVSFKVERHLERGLQYQDERWTIRVQRPDWMRVEYEGPPERVVVAKGMSYSEYIPAGKKALEVDLGAVEPKRQQEILAGLRPRVAIPGFRLGVTEEMWKNMDFRALRREQRDGRELLYIEGADKKSQVKTASSGRMQIWIDEARATLVRLEIYDGTRFISSIENQQFEEVTPHFWLPTKIVVRNSGAQSIEKASYKISKVQVNKPVDGAIFEAKYDAGVQVFREPSNPSVKDAKKP